MEQYYPDSEAALLDAIRQAMEGEAKLSVQGSGSLKGYGRQVACDAVLSTEKLAGIVDYQPEELLLTVKPGTSRREVEQVLQAHNQRLAFDPPDLGGLYGHPSGLGTIGGMIGTGLAGPGRLKHGAVRDHILAVRAVSGRGEVFKAGGKVVKNVTGYDLPKLLTGSMGTLAVLSEVTLKVLPAPEKTYTVLAFGLSPQQSVEQMSLVMSGSYEVAAACYLPDNVAGTSDVDLVKGPGTAVMAFRIEGPGPSVVHRCEALRQFLSKICETEELHSHRSMRFWQEVRDARLLQPLADHKSLWRLSVPPAAGAEVAMKLGHPYFLDWAGGLIWLVNEGQDPRPAFSEVGGQATLVRGKSDGPSFQPLSTPMVALTQRLKAAFDPLNILNPGRMYEGV